VYPIINPCRLLLFADDVKIVHAISSKKDFLTPQIISNQFTSWCDTDRLSLNNRKCKVMSIYLSTYKYDYHLNGHPHVRVDNINDLGFFYVSSLDFRPQIYIIACKALHVIGFIRRHSSNFNSHKCLSSLYNNIVKLLFEYGSVVWSPYTKSHLIMSRTTI